MWPLMSPIIIEALVQRAFVQRRDWSSCGCHLLFLKQFNGNLNSPCANILAKTSRVESVKIRHLYWIKDQRESGSTGQPKSVSVNTTRVPSRDVCEGRIAPGEGVYALIHLLGTMHIVPHLHCQCLTSANILMDNSRTTSLPLHTLMQSQMHELQMLHAYLMKSLHQHQKATCNVHILP